MLYHITSSKSVFTSSSSTNAFDDGTATSDTLQVDDGAYLIATGSTAALGANLATAGPWTATVNGTIYSAHDSAVWLRPTGTGTSTITIGTTGGIASDAKSAIVAESSVVINNSGYIIGGFDGAILFDGGLSHKVVNTNGQISVTDFGSSIIENVVGATDTIINSGGAILTAIDLAKAGKVTFSNSGFVSDVTLGVGDDVVTQTGIGDAKSYSLGAGNNTFTATSATSRVHSVDSGSGNDKVTNSGSIDQMFLGDGNNAITLSATSHVGVSGFESIGLGVGNDNATNAGTIFGTLDFKDGTNIFGNSGHVTGDYDGGLGNDQVGNSGVFIGDVTLLDGTNTFSNIGTFTGDVSGGGAIDTIINTKLWTGNLGLGDGSNSLTNSGTITGHVTGDDGIDKVTNSGTIGEIVDLGDGLNTVSNTGHLFQVMFGKDADHLTNSGSIDHAVILGDGENVLTNSGSIQSVEGGAQADVVVNTGKMGGVQLGAGDDHYTGGNNADFVIDGGGSDTVKLGGGDDLYYGVGGSGDGIDTVDGGAGIDSYTTNGSGFPPTSARSIINIDTVAHAEPEFLIASVAANSASGATGTDHVLNFENVAGADGDDVIMGSGASNRLDGSGGSDGLFGYGGNDALDGGAGDDALVGGSGRDFLTGGSGNDQFCFLATTDSTVARTGRDIITDFEDGKDKINLSGMDADTTTVGIQHFNYINVDSSTTAAAAFTHHAGELRSYATALGETIEADVNGDGAADFAIDVTDIGHKVTYTAADFVLM